MNMKNHPLRVIWDPFPTYMISNLFDNMHIWKSNNQRFWRCTNNYCQISRYFWKKIMFIFFAEFFLKIKCDTEYLNSKAWASEEGRKKAAISHFFFVGEKGKNVDRLNPDIFVITCCNCILTHNHVRVEGSGS